MRVFFKQLNVCVFLFVFFFLVGGVPKLTGVRVYPSNSMKREWTEMVDHVFPHAKCGVRAYSNADFRVDRGLENMSSIKLAKFCLKLEHGPSNIKATSSNPNSLGFGFPTVFCTYIDFPSKTVTVLSGMRLESGHGIVRISEVKTDLKNH